MADNTVLFIHKMQSIGLSPPSDIEPGKFHRFPGIGKNNGSTSGWCKLFPDGLGGVYGDWSTDLSETWQADKTNIDWPAFHNQVAQARKQAEKTRLKSQKSAAEKARSRWEKAGSVIDHEYLTNKKIQTYGTRQEDDKLIIPMRDGSGIIWAIQTIAPNGDKRFSPKGCRTKGLYYSIGGKPVSQPICVAEGFATAGAIFESTGYPVAVAFNAGNLETIAKTIKAKFPKNQLIICGDDDRKPDSDSNPGIEAATKAAQAVGGRVAVPATGEKADFWDLWNERGPEAVRDSITQAQNSSQSATTQGCEWQEPEPLPESISPVAPFIMDLLPNTVVKWANDIADRMQCAPEYVGVTLLTALASVLGRRVGIRPLKYDDWTVVPNMWALIVGRPGVLKSPSIEAGLASIRRLSAEARDRYEIARTQYEVQEAIAKLEIDENRKKARKKIADGKNEAAADLLKVQQPEEPIERRYMVNDTTAASLAEIHRHNPYGLLVHRDEMVSLLKMLDQEEHAGARGFYLTGWNGDSAYTVDRIGRGMNLHIPAVCLSLLGSTQPSRLSGYIKTAIRGGSGDDGLIQRFGLLVWPDVTTWKDVDRLPDTTAKKQCFEIFNHLDQLNPESAGAQQDVNSSGNPDGLPYFRFNDEALEIFKGWRVELEARLSSDDIHPAVESHLAKYRKLVPSIALVTHLSENGTGPIGKVPLLKALAWAEYLETHAERAYGSAVMPDISAAKAILSRVRKGDLDTSFTSREVWRPGWAGLSESKVANAGLEVLVEYGWLRTKVVETGGRPKTIYHVNPRRSK